MILESDVASFIDLTGDNNPLHVDDMFAQAQGFSGRVVHGLLAASYISTLLGTLLPGSGTVWLKQNLEFTRPVYLGDEITVEGEVKRVSRGTRALIIATRVFNQRGELVIDGSACVKMPKLTR